MISFKNIIKKLRGNKADIQINRAKCFGEDLDYNGPFDYIDRGVYKVPLNQILGSVSKCSAFSNRFTLQAHIPPDRLFNIKKIMKQGKSLPPLNLYKVSDEYYVMDGNHRVAAAKEFGRINIMAKVIELIPSK